MFYTMSGDVLLPQDSHQAADAKRRFAKVAANSGNWFASASRLTFAMSQLEPSVRDFWRAACSQGTDHEEPFPSQEECVSIHLMLAGLAVENLCKGYLVQRLPDDQRRVLNDGTLPSDLNSKHRVLDLVRLVCIPTDADEQNLLKRVEDCVQYIARYPVPMKFGKLKDEVLAAGDVDRINAFLSRLRDHCTR